MVISIPSTIPFWMSQLKPTDSNAWCGFLVYFLGACAVYHFAFIAVCDVGNLFGWLIGASNSPIASAAAPLVFGLLGTVVFASLLKLLATVDRVAMARDLVPVPGLPETLIRRSLTESRKRLVTHAFFAIVLMNLTSQFVYQARLGIKQGTQIRANTDEPRAPEPGPRPESSGQSPSRDS